MSHSPAFTITYWGATGTFCDPLLPRQVTDKIAEAIRVLVASGRWSQLSVGPSLREDIRQILEEELPFYLRSSYGGNTTCVEVQAPDSLFILDCGSGFRELGISLDTRWSAEGDKAKRTADVLLTHAHIDHTFSTPYFSPYYDSRNAFTIWGPQVVLDSLTAVLDANSALSKVYFPPTYNEMKGIKAFNRLEPGSDFHIGSTRITTYALTHPGGSMAYRFENAGKVFVFATDHEHSDAPDAGLAEFARGADLLYTEGQYTRSEYDGTQGIAGDRPMSRHGWGHSPIEACVITAVEAAVRRLHIGHRDPRRNDAQISDFETYLRILLEKRLSELNLPQDACEALVPYEGMRVEL